MRSSMSLKSFLDGLKTITPELNRSEWRRTAQKPGHLNNSSKLLTATVSASKKTTAQRNSTFWFQAMPMATPTAMIAAYAP
jgi:hypothetical protein